MEKLEVLELVEGGIKLILSNGEITLKFDSEEECKEVYEKIVEFLVDEDEFVIVV